MEEEKLPEAAEPEEQGNPGLQLLFDVLDIVQAGVVAVFLFLLAFAYILQPVNVDGTSMVPTLQDTDRLIMSKLLLEPKNGRIVIINDEKAGHFTDGSYNTVYETSGLGIVIVKRVIATAGQEIRIDKNAGEVYVDGVLLDEPYIADPTTRDDESFTYPFTVPEGYIFVMGDNRLHSTDSRNPAVALVPEREVMGVALARIDRSSDYLQKWTDRFGWLLT